MAAILVVLSNGPVFLFSKSVLDRSGRWEDPAVWPFFAAAAAASAALFAWGAARAADRTFTGSQKAAAVAVASYTLVALASTAWSVEPASTLWRAAVYAGLAMLAWTVACLDSDEIAAVLFTVTGTAVAASILLVMLRADLGVDSNDDWQGVYTNRNSLAPLGALGVLVGVRFLAGRDLRSRIAGGGLAVMGLAALGGAGSRTAWIAMLVAATAAAVPLVFAWVRGRWGRGPAAAVTSGVGAVAAAACLIGLAAFWDEATFSQRRTIWSLVWDRVLERPLAGYGFFAFWDVTELLDHALLRRGSAHNSLMEVALGLGLIGTVPFLVIVALAARNAALNLWRRPGADSWMWAAVVGFALVENVTESFVLWFSYMWVLLMAAALRPVHQSPARPSRRGDDAGMEPTPAGATRC